MIWSIIPEELIFAAEPRCGAEGSGERPRRRAHMSRSSGDGPLSTDPLDYLDRRFWPVTAVDAPDGRGRR